MHIIGEKTLNSNAFVH